MIVASRMSKVLPEGSAPDPDALHAFGDRLNQVATGLFKACRDQAELTRTPPPATCGPPSTTGGSRSGASSPSRRSSRCSPGGTPTAPACPSSTRCSTGA
ncbi:hypothetical protein V2I01_04965 [Micromonospora sp. BRA006-A]|nr:hypothetical protein [Micromonospora sp. BRA006-A]